MATIALRGHRESPPQTLIPDKRTVQRLAPVQHLAALLDNGTFNDLAVTVAHIPGSDAIHGLVVALDGDSSSKQGPTLQPTVSTLSGTEILKRAKDIL